MSEFKFVVVYILGALVLSKKKRRKGLRCTYVGGGGGCISDCNLRLLSPFFPAWEIKKCGVGVVISACI